MQEVISASFSTINLIPTVLLLLVLVYWLTVIVGVFNIDTFDFETSADGDVDIEFGESFIWLNSALSFFNLGRVPIMIILSFFALSLWFCSILVNHYLGITSMGFALVLLIPEIIISAFVSKFFSTPFVKLFKKDLSVIESNEHLTGKMCTVTLEADAKNFGQAEIKIDGTSLIINVLATEEGMVLPKGESCLVIDYLPERKLYLIESYKN